MTTTAKAIETRYKGYRFRSRLEARWAVYFDALGIKWEYEKEGYKLPSGWYLPDFWLPQVEMWAEVKSGEFSHREFAKALDLAIGTQYNVLLLDGVPAFQTYRYIGVRGDESALRSFGFYLDDCVIDNRYLKERRFYTNTGCPWSNREGISDRWFGEKIREAVKAARGARFEHHETPHR